MVKKKVKKEKTVENTIKKDEKVDNMQILVFDEDDTYMEEQKKLSIISKNGDTFKNNTLGSEETVKEREEEVPVQKGFLRMLLGATGLNELLSNRNKEERKRLQAEFDRAYYKNRKSR